MAAKGRRSLPPDPVPWQAYDQPIRIVVPAEVGFDLGSLQKGLANLAKRLGHENCLSGRSCVLANEWEYVINPASLEVEGLESRGF